MPEGVGAAVTTAGAAVAVACFTTEVISLGSGTLSCALTAMVDAAAPTMAANTAPAIPIRFRLTRLISPPPVRGLRSGYERVPFKSLSGR